MLTQALATAMASDDYQPWADWHPAAGRVRACKRACCFIREDYSSTGS